MVQITNNVGRPTAAITVNRNRLKTYGEKVYMKSGTNFEIEFFNPFTSRVLAMVEIDGRSISSNGLVINPGQRVYLERWIDEAKKFKFSTYSVENSKEALQAISSNGKVKVSFYTESSTYSNLSPFYTSSPSIVYPSWTPGTLPGTIIYGGSGSITTNGAVIGQTTTTNLVNGQITSTYTDSSVGTVNTALYSSQIETGRAEKGEKSSQEMNYTSGSFNYLACEVFEFQILPDAHRPVEAGKVRSYCTECGTRVRAASWKFCPSCGEKF